MKCINKLLFYLAILPLYFTLWGCRSRPANYSGITQIKDAKNFPWMHHHEIKDVEVYKYVLDDTSNIYEIVFYNSNDGKIQENSTSFGSKKSLTMANFNWFNDTVSIKLLGADSVSPDSFKLCAEEVKNNKILFE